MILRSRWLWAAPTCLVVVALSCGAAGAADKTKVDQATTRVEKGAKQIGDGKVGRGFIEMFKGIHYTIFEGTKYSGKAVGEFFERTFRG
jgi:hypothetical protein